MSDFKTPMGNITEIYTYLVCLLLESVVTKHFPAWKVITLGVYTLLTLITLMMIGAEQIASPTSVYFVPIPSSSWEGRLPYSLAIGPGYGMPLSCN
jgi:hypothetical protein